VDSINGSNLTVLETYGLNDRQAATIDTELERDLIKSFPKIPSNIIALTAFAEANDLDLEISETNGSGSAQLATTLTVAAPVENSTTADTTPEFSGTGTPGGLVTITIDTDEVEATVDASGDWSVNWSPALASAEHIATVSLVKGGISATSVVRTFTVS
jgi:hypothetical protein